MTQRLPDNWRWLEAEPGPKMLREAIKEFGTLEAPGEESNPTIIAWAKEVGHVNPYTRRFYTSDETPWCGLFVALCAVRAGKPIPGNPLWALNWAKWGEDGGQPELGDVLVFNRPGGAHVALYVGEDRSDYFVLGGNQSNAVNIARIRRERLYACRQLFATGKPPNVRPIRIAVNGTPLSTNEA
jgi:uncharacterized protein (TIGR02594 family)